LSNDILKDFADSNGCTTPSVLMRGIKMVDFYVWSDTLDS